MREHIHLAKAGEYIELPGFWLSQGCVRAEAQAAGSIEREWVVGVGGRQGLEGTCRLRKGQCEGRELSHLP